MRFVHISAGDFINDNTFEDVKMFYIIGPFFLLFLSSWISQYIWTDFDAFFPDGTYFKKWHIFLFQAVYSRCSYELAADAAMNAAAFNTAAVRAADWEAGWPINYSPSAAYSGMGAGNVAVAGDLDVTGSTLVSGLVPVIGFVNFVGEVPATGAVSIVGACGCGCEYWSLNLL